MLDSGVDSTSPIDSFGARAERYAALVANTKIAAAAAIGIHRFGRGTSRDIEANRRGRSASENSRRAGRDIRGRRLFHFAIQHRRRQREDAKRVIALLASLQMRQQFGPPFGGRRLAP